MYRGRERLEMVPQAGGVVRERGGWDWVEEHGREFQKSFGSGSNNTGNRLGMGT